MSEYRCYFARSGRAPTLEVIKSDRDGEAITRARELLARGSADVGFEIWNAERLVVRVAMPSA